MSTDAQTPTPESPSSPGRHLLAPWWHTALLIAALLFASLNGTRSAHLLAARNKLPLYLWTMAWEWILFGFTWLGIRNRIRLRDLIGGRWLKLEDFFLDLLYAATFWIAALFVLGIGAKLLHLEQAGRLAGMRRELGFLIPASSLEMVAWFCVSITAGFCEEIIFRGYLQRQFAIAAGAVFPGVLLSAVVFGASHGYEGVARMILIAIYGLMFGLLAWWRNSLRPGMMAHAWHDAFGGVLLHALK